MTVYANGHEIASKKSSNKTVCAMPDVCNSPPSPPAGPIPIPYPNTAMASDTDGGSKKVLIQNEMAMLKNRSSYKKSVGDQAATNSFGAGLVTHKIGGGMKFGAYSFDVKFENANVCRQLDITTGNHGSDPQNTVDTGVSLGLFKPATAGEVTCEALHDKNEEDRQNLASPTSSKAAQDCAKKGTITHFSLETGGKTVLGMSRSRVLAKKYDNGPAASKGTNIVRDNKGKVAEKNAGFCDGSHTYKNNNQRCPDQSHTEPRILEEIAKFVPSNTVPKPKVKMAINWPTPKNPNDKNSPCPKCEEAICAASNCMDIVICDKARGEETDGKSYCKE